jgi:hypothetical protein
MEAPLAGDPVNERGEGAKWLKNGFNGRFKLSFL